MTYHNQLHARLYMLITDMTTMQRNHDEFDYSIVIDQLTDALITMEDLKAFDINDLLAAQEEMRKDEEHLDRARGIE